MGGVKLEVLPFDPIIDIPYVPREDGVDTLMDTLMDTLVLEGEDDGHRETGNLMETVLPVLNTSCRNLFASQSGQSGSLYLFATCPLL